MNIKEKLSAENPDESLIRLYHEGIFYTAYGYSAVRVKKELFPDVCLIQQRKKDGSSYFRIGIVQNSPALAQVPIKDNDDNYVPFLTVPYNGSAFSLDEIIPDKVISAAQNDRKTLSENVPEHKGKDVEGRIVDEIRSLDMSSLTPVKAMQLVLSWYESLNEPV